MPERTRHSSPEDYFAALPPASRAVLMEIRRRVQAAFPDAQEILSYQMPAFRDGKVFFHYAAFRSHVGIYPPVRGDAALQEALLPYRGPKGNLRFPLDPPPPYDLILRVAQALHGERRAKPSADGK